MRIHITGNAGSGKTTLARELGEILEIDVFGLDKIVWKENWGITSKEERIFLEQGLTRKKKWIIEGVSSTARQSADYVIFLDFSRLTCLKRGVLRSLKYLFSTRPELPENCPEYKIVHKLIKIIWQFNKYARPIIIDDLKNKNCITITSNSDLYNFIENVRHNKIINYAPTAPDSESCAGYNGVMHKDMKKMYRTDSGMLCIWNYDSFKHIHDYDTWDEELCEDEDISRNIKNRSFVPLNLGDGAFEVEIRLCENNLTDREREYLLVPSQSYALNTSGTICVSGLEHVAGDADENVETIKFKPGEYVIQANLIDWNQEPGAVDSDGNPTNIALPDMIVFITENGNPNMEYRTEIETFREQLLSDPVFY